MKVNTSAPKTNKLATHQQAALDKLEGEAVNNHLLLWQLGHGFIKSRVQPKAGKQILASLKVTGDVKAYSGKAAAVLAEASNARLFDGSVSGVRGYGGNDGTISVSISGSPIGKFLADCIEETVKAACTSIKSGEFPFILCIPMDAKTKKEKPELLINHESGEWKLDYRLSLMTVATMGLPLEEKGSMAVRTAIEEAVKEFKAELKAKPSNVTAMPSAQTLAKAA